MLGDAAADARQHVREPREAARLADLAHLLPVRMIAVLQPAGGIAPDGLQMRGRILRVQHVGVGRRHGEARQPPHRGALADHAVVGIEIGPAFAAAAPADRQGIGGDEPQAQALRQRLRATRLTPAMHGRGALALENVRGCIGHGTGSHAGLKLQDSNAGRRGLVPCRPGRGAEPLPRRRRRR